MTPTPFRENLRGIVSLSLCNLLFIINDMMMKLASEHGLPLSQLLFLRGLFAVPILVVAVVLTRSYVHWRLLWNRGVAGRITGEAFGATTYLTALFVIPFANANTIAQLAPLAITAAARDLLPREGRLATVDRDRRRLPRRPHRRPSRVRRLQRREPARRRLGRLPHRAATSPRG